MKKLFVRSAVVATAVASSSAFAEAVDVATTIATMQTDMTSNLTLVGTALVALSAVAVGFKWIKGMIFG